MENPDTQANFNRVARRIYDMIWKVSIANNLITPEMQEDPSLVTASEIMQKIRAFLKQEPSDENALVFLRYLAAYPVSMCKRDVSPFLKFLIGFHYRLGVPTKSLEENGAQKVSYDDLAELFDRSKATVSSAIQSTETKWQEFKAELEQEKEIELEAKKQLIEERKQKMNEEEQRNRRT